jgi:Glu-tRNA(Gln) amidotransferase subunit E-like FAD-binding protein
MEGTMPAQAAATVGGGIGGTLTATKIETLNPEEMESLGNILQRDQSAIVAVFDQVAVPMDELDTEEQATRDEILTKVGRDIGNTLQEGQNVPFGIAVMDDESIVGDAHGHLCGGGRD